MTLKDNLYSIQGCVETDNSFTYTISLNPECFIYSAHFPGNPITPGVCILQILTELLEEHTHSLLELQTVNNVKYLAIISPVEQPTIDYVLSPIITNDGEIRAKAVVQNGNGTFAKISVTYKTHRGQ